jgi:hypothetical protein
MGVFVFKRRVQPGACPVSALALGAAVSAAFLFAAVEPLRLFEFDAADSSYGAYYSSRLILSDCLAVSPKIGGNMVENTFSPLRFGSLRLFMPLGTFNVPAAFSIYFIIRKKHFISFSIKNSILLKLRI